MVFTTKDQVKHGEKRKIADVLIFYAPMCGLCHKAMDYFKAQDIPFEACEVKWTGDGWEDTPNASRMKELCGDVDFVPQLIVNGRHIQGWRTLEPMIESGELKQWLSSPQSSNPHIP